LPTLDTHRKLLIDNGIKKTDSTPKLIRPVATGKKKVFIEDNNNEKFLLSFFKQQGLGAVKKPIQAKKVSHSAFDDFDTNDELDESINSAIAHSSAEKTKEEYGIYINMLKQLSLRNNHLVCTLTRHSQDWLTMTTKFLATPSQQLLQAKADTFLVWDLDLDPLAPSRTVATIARTNLLSHQLPATRPSIDLQVNLA